MVRRMSKSYPTIKAFVFDYIHSTKGVVDYNKLTKAVLKCFPESKWKKTHWSWYRNQIVNGQFKKQFSEEERVNLVLNKKEQPENHDVKRIGDAILSHARFIIQEFAKDNADIKFKLNRWVYARLMQDEIREKKPVKQKLWDSGMRSCQKCGKKFNTLKGVEIHRKDSAVAYSVKNCELLCRPCHQKPM